MKKKVPRKPDHPMYAISRIDSGSTHTWYVRLKTSDRLISASFSDRKHGGKRRALRAAKEWRETNRPHKKEHPHRYKSWGPKPSLQHARNKTGVAGVNIRIKYAEDGSIKTVLWEATWRVPDPRRKKGSLHTIIKTKSFSVTVYGYRGAFLWAAQTRAEKLGMEINLRKLITPPPPQNILRWLESKECLSKRVTYSAFST